jgi:hypothetical protein
MGITEWDRHTGKGLATGVDRNEGTSRRAVR